VTDPASVLARPAVRRAATIALLAIMAALLVSSSRHKRLVYDEPDNLSYGYRFLAKGPGVAPLGQRMPVLIANALPCLASGCDLESLNRSEGARMAVRAGTMVCALALAALVATWAGRMFGPVGALAALWIAVFDPTLLAHGKQVTSDVAVAFFMTAAVYAYWRWRERRRAWSLAACALATAGAMASKFSGLLLIPILGLLWAADALRESRQGAPRPRGDILRGAMAAVAFGLGVLVLVNAAYLFRGSFRLASSYQWQSEAFREHITWRMPVPLPRVFAEGLDYSSYLQENPDKARGYNYVLGALNRDGRWYAFPLMLLLKTPLPVFALALMGMRSPAARGTSTLLAVPFLVVMLFFSLAVDPQLGIRYVLPALPFVWLAAARGASDLRGWRRWMVPVLLAWQAASTLSYHPHFIPYFNELIGRRVNAYKYLADSNLDWEDHAYFIEEFRRQHPEKAIVTEPAAGKPTAGWILVGANDLVGVFEPERYRWLREGFGPVGQVAYSHFLFDVSRTPPHDDSAPAQ
jgi:hypothetical protein